jgi:small GTP-binding protein
MILAKVCILGDISVGKTSLVRRYVDREFSDSYLSSVGVKISRKRLEFPSAADGQPSAVQLVLWDLEGGSTFRQVADSYLKGAHAALIVGDVSRPETLESIPSHMTHFLGINPQGLIVVALNKADLLSNAPPPVSHPWDTGERMRETVYTSAKTGEGVDQLFNHIGLDLVHELTSGSSH